MLYMLPFCSEVEVKPWKAFFNISDNLIKGDFKFADPVSSFGVFLIHMLINNPEYKLNLDNLSHLQ